MYRIAILVDFKLLWTRKLWVLLATATALAAGFGYLKVAEPTYEVEARVLVENRGLSATGGLENATRYREFLATQGEILSSERIIGPATKSTPQWKALRTEEAREQLVADVIENFEVATVVNTDVLRLRFRGKDPTFAVNLIDAVLEGYASHIREDDKDRFGGILESLTRSEQEIREELSKKSQALADCRSKNGLVGTGRDMVHVQLSSLNNLTDRLADTRRNRLELQLKLGSLKSEQGAELALVSHEFPDTGNSLSPQLRNNASDELTEARGAYDVVREQWQAQAAFDEAAVRFGPKHPEYQAAKERAEEWKKYTKQHNASLIQMLDNELAAVEQVESELQQLVNDEYKNIKTLDTELLVEQQLTSEIARIEAAHAIAIERLRDYKLTDAHLEQGKSSTNIVVLSQPKTPDEPIWPQPIPFMGICGLFGSILSCLAALYL